MDAEETKITYAKNLKPQTFTMTISVPIDTNVNIKKVMGVKTYLFDTRVETGSGKAVVNGKVGIKVLYLDTDNMTSTIADSQSFSETIVDPSITADGFVCLTHHSIATQILSTEGTLKVGLEVTLNSVLYLNLGLNSHCNQLENMVVKKSELTTYEINEKINTNFEYTVNMESKDNVSKILSYDALFSPTQVTANNEYAVVDGKIHSTLIYETMREDEPVLVELNEVFPLKQEINLTNLDRDCLLDLHFALDNSKEDIKVETEENSNVLTITHNFVVSGVSMKPLTIDVVDDMYSTDNEVELSRSEREYGKVINHECVEEKVEAELSLADGESAIDEVLCNINPSSEITNQYIKDSELYFEGIVTSHLIYVDENKEKSGKLLEIPFVVNTHISMEKLGCVHGQVGITDCKVKAKRGTKIEVSYTLTFSVCYYVYDTHSLVDNVTIGKPVDFGGYDYQIFIAKPNETMWELSKRIKVSPDELTRTNKNLPLVMEGGEKVIIKR